MFSIPEMIRTDQLAMRPIIKRPHSIPSLKMDRCTTTCLSHSDTPFPHYGAQKMSTTYQSGRVLPTLLPPTSYMCTINTPKNTARGWTDWYGSKKIFKINENAVRLDDIDASWYTKNETVCVPNISYHKEYDDTDLDLFLIHQEAQEYNDSSNYQRKLDFCFLTSVLHQALEYIEDLGLQHMRKENKSSLKSLLDHFERFGYDCLIRLSDKGVPKKSVAVIKNLLLSSGIKKDVNNIAVDFGIRFSWCNMLITTCNQHFEKSQKRMCYTQRFYKSC